MINLVQFALAIYRLSFLIFCTKKPADIYPDGKLPLVFFFMLGFVSAFLAIKKFEVVLSALIRKCAEKINHYHVHKF